MTKTSTPILTALGLALALTPWAGAQTPPLDFDGLDPDTPVEAGSSRVLPDLSGAFERISQGFESIPEVVAAAKEGKEEIQPLLDEFQANRSLENQGKLERALARYSSNLARKIRGATAKREQVVFAFQDVVRGVSSMQTSLGNMAGDLQRRAVDEKRELADVTERLRDVAHEWEVAEGAEKEVLMHEFKQLYRQRKRMGFRAYSIQNIATKYQNLVQAVGKFGGALNQISGRLEDVFDRLEDSEMMLTFTAGYRRDMTDVVASYQRSFGEGGSVKQILENIKSLQGQLNLLDTTIAVVDEADALGPLLEDVSKLTSEIADEDFGSGVVGGEDGWEMKIEDFLSGADELNFKK